VRRVGNTALKICQFFRFGLHPYKLATLRTTTGLIIASCYGIKQGICYVTKNVCGQQPVLPQASLQKPLVWGKYFCLVVCLKQIILLIFSH